MRALALLSLLILGGCGFTPQGDALRNAIRSYGSQAYDEGLDNAEWLICHAASIGSIRRKYGRNPEVYRQFCEGTGNLLRDER